MRGPRRQAIGVKLNPRSFNHHSQPSTNHVSLRGSQYHSSHFPTSVTPKPIISMTTFSPYPAYILGTACMARGAMAILSPRAEYANIGLPLEPAPGVAPSSAGRTSPLMHFKGIKELTIGLALVALQAQAGDRAVTTYAAVLSLARLAEGVVVWLKGGDELRYRAWGHWITGAGFVGWVAWRVRVLRAS